MEDAYYPGSSRIMIVKISGIVLDGNYILKIIISPSKEMRLEKNSRKLKNTI